MNTIHLELYCTDFPGLTFGACHPVHLAVQKGKNLEGAAPGDSEPLTFSVPLEVSRRHDGSPSFRGPYAHGKPGEQHVYLVWFTPGPGGPETFRRAKVMLDPLTWEVINRGKPVRAHIRLTDAQGGPVCARLREGQIRWELGAG